MRRPRGSSAALGAWQSSMKAFISYSSIDKKHGGAVKKALEEIGIEPFLAHNDVKVSEQWQERILEELAACKLFIPLLSKSLKESVWCNQEIGFIVRRKKNVLTVPISLDGTKPYGFIAHLQSHKIPTSGLDPETVLDAVGRKWPSVVIEGKMKPMEPIYSFRSAESVVAPLVPYFDKFTAAQANEFARLANGNGQIWDAHLCRSDYLPKFLKINKSKIGTALYSELYGKVHR